MGFYTSSARLAIFASLMLTLNGCTAQEAGNHTVASDECAERASLANPRDSVFVSRKYSGGKQCDGETAERPDADQILRDNCVVVFESSYEMLDVCNACDVCPDYAVLHHARIWRRDLSSVEGLGYSVKRRSP